MKQLAYICQHMAWISLFFVKASFLAFYWNIVTYTQRRIRIVLILAAVWTAISFLVILFTWLFYCGTPSASWAPAPLTCDPIVQVTPQAIATAFNLSSDLLIMAVPIMLLNALVLSKRENTALCFVFGIGAISIIASGAKGITIFVATENFKVQSSGQLITNLSALEFGAALLAASLPTLRILVFRRDETSIRKRKQFEHGQGSSGISGSGGKRSRGLSEGESGFEGSRAGGDEEWLALGKAEAQVHVDGMVFQTEHR